MAVADYKPIGEWKKANRIIRALQKNLNQLSADGLEYLGKFYEAEVKEGIESQQPGGMPFAELAPATSARKGSEKALIEHNDMMMGVTSEMMHGTAVFVGGLRQEEHEASGKPMANLMQIHEEGTDDGVIPPRPFLEPIISSGTIRKKANRVVERYLRRRVRRVFR